MHFTIIIIIINTHEISDISSKSTYNRKLLRYTRSHLILEVPDAVTVSKLIVRRATLGENATLKATHVEEQVGIVLAVHRHKAVLPQCRRHRPRQTVLYVPEYCSTTATHYYHSVTLNS